MAVDDRGPGTVRTGQRTQPDRGERIAGLVRAARQGSEDALGQIVTELSPLLWQVARAAGLSPGDAEDVLQTVWLRLIAHLDDIHTSAALTGWLVTTTRREAWRVRAAGRKHFPADHGIVRRRCPTRSPDRRSRSSSTISAASCGRRSASSPRAARNCCGSSPSCPARTTRRWRPSSACRSAASAPPAAGAWPSSAPCSPPTRRELTMTLA